MQIAPVHYEHLFRPFDYLVVTRAHPSGRVDRLHVTRRFKVSVARHDGVTTQFGLDASEAEDLLHALNAAAQAAPTHRDAGSQRVFDIELGWSGRSVRLHGLALPEDEAVSGVLQFAQRVFDEGGEPITARRQPASTGL